MLVLIELFPDYKEDMKRLLDDAEYLDEKLGVLVKDGILVSYGTEFRVVDLEKAVSASVLRQKSKWGGNMILHSSMEAVSK